MEERKYFIARRKSLSAEYKKNASLNIISSCVQIIHKKQPKTIALFCATLDEPNILPLLLKFPDLVFCVPKIISDTQIKMFAIDSLEDLEKGKFGILEPKPHCTEIFPENIDMIFVPAVALDSNGNRLGMGKGYYDRYLSQCPSVFKIGVVFADQISKKDFIPQPWDMKMDQIITE